LTVSIRAYMSSSNRSVSEARLAPLEFD